MEYYIYVTHDCNLRCLYCSNAQVRTKSVDINTDAVANLVSKDDDATVVFYGGEPLLNQTCIKELIHKTPKAKHILHTNGTLLDRADDFILKKSDYIFISIDGEHRLHDRMRGKGTFQKIVDNLYAVRHKFKGKTLARLTIGPQSNVYSAAVGVVNWFDNVHWQLENGPFGITPSFLLRYREDLKNLADFWTRHLENGIVKNIIPFQTVANSLVLGNRATGFRCGCGSRLVAVDTDGNCYSCDDLIRHEKYKIGNCTDGIKLNPIKSEECNTCSIFSICGGRCFMAKEKWADKSNSYCYATHALVNAISTKREQLKKLIENKIIPAEAFANPAAILTEGIP